MAARAPLGHGLGSAGEATKLKGESLLRAPDNGYLALMYQVGPVGFLLVVAALGYVLRGRLERARAPARPGQDLRLVLFAMFVYLLVTLAAGDEFYGSHGVIFWFIAGQVLAYDFRRRAQAAQRVAPAHRLGVELLQAVADARPGEALLDDPAVVRAHRPPQLGIAEDLRQRVGQRGRVARGDLAAACVRTRCWSPPAAVATTGRAQAIASSAVMPNGSP